MGMGQYGVFPGFALGVIITLLVRWLFPHVWAESLIGMEAGPDWLKIASWVLFIGFPLSLLFGTERQKLVLGLVYCVFFLWPVAALILLGKRALPPFFMRGYDDGARWCAAFFGLLFGTCAVMWFCNKLGRPPPGMGAGILHFLDRVFGRKK